MSGGLAARAGAFLLKARGRLFSRLTGEPMFTNDDMAARERFGPSELARVFRDKQGKQVHKWHHYLEIYERHLGHLRGTEFRMLEIGVFRGGSLELWRQYFGEKAIIYGIDIDPRCAAYDGQGGQVRIGSQDDPAFLARVVEEMGGVDVVIDDGSHDSRHITASFEALFPRLSEGGVYIAEDLHCCYWPSFSGGYRWPWSFISVAKGLVDDMHHWYHRRGERNRAAAGHLKALHFYDSMVVMEKERVARPINTLRPLGDAPGEVARAATEETRCVEAAQ
ncbi:MAG: class I SAM-dependent methyltransferase [Pseudomonadota bacterium]